MEAMWTQVKKRFQRERAMSSVKLVDRRACPAFLSLTGLALDPDLLQYTMTHTRQLQLDLGLPVDGFRGDLCSCPDRIDREMSVFRLGKKVSANDADWQDSLAQALVEHVLSHLSASIEVHIHHVFATSSSAASSSASAAAAAAPLEWRAFCHRQNRSNPHAVLEAAGRAIVGRVADNEGGLRLCAVMGSLLNTVEDHCWRVCANYQVDQESPEERWVYDELVFEAFDAYMQNPSRGALEMAQHNLRMSLQSRPIHCGCDKHRRQHG